MEAEVADSRSASVMIRRLVRDKGAMLLVAGISIFYWLPVLLWLGGTVFSDRPQLPPNFPFTILVWRTVSVAGVTAVLSTVLAYPVALVWRMLSPRGRRLLSFVLVMPMIMGALARNYSWRAMLSSENPLASLGWCWLNGPNLQYTALSVHIVMICVFVPVAFFILIQGSLAATQEQVNAARTLGASDNTIIRSVICPQMNRSAILAIGLVFSMAAGYFITPQMIGGSKLVMMGNAVYTYVNIGQFGIAAIIGLWFLVIMMVPVVAVLMVSLQLRFISTGR
jgi:putative spermidine/putrescine transport system permease protein